MTVSLASYRPHQHYNALWFKRDTGLCVIHLHLKHSIVPKCLIKLQLPIGISVGGFIKLNLWQKSYNNNIISRNDKKPSITESLGGRKGQSKGQLIPTIGGQNGHYNATFTILGFRNMYQLELHAIIPGQYCGVFAGWHVSIYHILHEW